MLDNPDVSSYPGVTWVALAGRQPSMATSCHEVEYAVADSDFASDVNSFSLEQQTCFPAMLTSSDSDVSAVPPRCSLSSTLPLTTSIHAPGPAHTPKAAVARHGSPERVFRHLDSQRSSDWQAHQVSISTFVRRFPERSQQPDGDHGPRKSSIWQDLPQIELMVRSGYTRPPICPPKALTVGKLLGCGGQAQVCISFPDLP